MIPSGYKAGSGRLDDRDAGGVAPEVCEPLAVELGGDGGCWEKEAEGAWVFGLDGE